MVDEAVGIGRVIHDSPRYQLRVIIAVVAYRHTSIHIIVTWIVPYL